MEKINLKLLIIGLLILIPIFITFSSNGITLSRVAHFDNNKSLFTLPISFFFFIYIFKSYLFKALYKLIFTKVFLISFFLLIVQFIINFKFNYLFHKNIFSFLLFCYIINVSELYFYEKLYFVNILERINKYDYLCIYPAVIHILIILISYNFYGKPAYLLKDIMIFNYEQYLSIAFIPALYVFRNYFFKILIWFLIILIGFKTNNNTTYLIIFTYICLLCLPLKILNKETQINFIKIIIYLISLLGICYWVFEINDYFIEILNQGGHVSRTEILKNFWLKLNLYNSFLPFLGTDKIFSVSEYHNQYLNFYHTFGLFSLYLLWKLIKFTLKVYKINKNLAFLIIGIFSIGGLTINTILHPYLLIYFAILIGFLSGNIKLINETKI